MLIAEISENHDGDVVITHQVPNALALVSASFVKFQIYKPDKSIVD